jgi:hypothetical protein
MESFGYIEVLGSFLTVWMIFAVCAGMGEV